MGYPIPESDIAGEETYEWADEDDCTRCGHSYVWANLDGECTYSENGVRCSCAQHL